MKVNELNEDTFKIIKNKKIIIIEKSISYLDELTKSYDILSNVFVILDENKRKCGTFLYKEKEMTVYHLDYLKNLDLDEKVIVITSDYYKEYIEKIEKLLKPLKKTGDIFVFYNYETEIELKYRKQYTTAYLQDIIVFRSGPPVSEYVKGMDFSDNSRALFEYMLSIGLNEKYELVWFVKNPKEFQKYQYKNVSFLPYEASTSNDVQVRDAYYRALCLAKYIFFTDAYGFARNCREDQTRVQLWHGCGYKKRLNDTPCEKRYEYMTVTSDLYADIHAKIFGLRKDQLLITGCAKEDWLFEKNEDIFIELKIPKASKYIFWLPTYRFSSQDKDKLSDGKFNEETGLPLISSSEEIAALNKILAQYKTVLVIKLHPFQDKTAIHFKSFSNIVLLDNDILFQKDIQINQLLGKADALISDYSSTIIDYLVLDKPMAFILDDIESYSDTRGFIFDDITEWLPGFLVYKFEDLFIFITEIITDVDSSKNKRKYLAKILHKNRDNNNSKRILEDIIGNTYGNQDSV